eukprot:2577343-Pleurochrysis_carterae.AAC.1
MGAGLECRDALAAWLLGCVSFELHISTEDCAHCISVTQHGSSRSLLSRSPSWPAWLRPHTSVLPLRVKAMVWSAPALTAKTRSADGSGARSGVVHM